MYIRVKSTPNSPRKSVQIVESVRDGTKVKQRIVRHVGVAMDEVELELLRTLAKQLQEKISEESLEELPLFPGELFKSNKPVVKDNPLVIKFSELREEQRIVEGIHEVFGEAFNELGFNQIFGKGERGRTKSEVLRDTVLARLSNPVSKLQTSNILEQDFGLRVPVDRIYRMMDALSEKESVVKNIVANGTLSLFKQEVDILLYDVTTLSFETQSESAYRKFGYSKDGKFNEVQLVLGLVTNRHGLPLSYALFPGNTSEGKTCINVLEEFAQQFKVNRVICVADRAMFSEENLTYIESKKWEFIVAAKLRTLSNSTKTKVLAECEKIKQLNLPSKNIQIPNTNRRIVLSYSKDRENKDLKDRTRSLERLARKLSPTGNINPNKLVSNKAAKKFLETEKNGTLNLSKNKIDNDAKWDGIHGVITNAKITDAEVLTIYATLWQIEAAFRLNKHDLKIRPIFHWNDNRIIAHISICFITFAIAKYVEYRVAIQQKKLSFAQIQHALRNIQASILKDNNTKKLYRIPSKINPNAKIIYKAFNLKRNLTPSQL